MGKPHPFALRERVVAFVEEGNSHRSSAAHFRMRGLGNVRTEMAFHVLAYNIKRMIALIGVRGLLAAIPA